MALAPLLALHIAIVVWTECGVRRSTAPRPSVVLLSATPDEHGGDAFLAQLNLDLIDQHTTAIDELTARIEVVIEPFRGARDLLVSIPGISASSR